MQKQKKSVQHFILHNVSLSIYEKINYYTFISYY